MSTRNRTKTNNNMRETYSATPQGVLRRIRTPHPHDVLSGRGGGINSHFGNKTFREWVRQRKEAYNLAPTKAQKAKVANEVIDLVRSQNPPGRFLQKDPTTVSSPGWWVEVDEGRAIAKTSQALREGAPQIRAAHKTELEESTPDLSSSTHKKPSVAPVIPASSPTLVASRTASRSTETALRTLQKNAEEAKSMADNRQAPPPQMRPLMSNHEFNHTIGRPAKRLRLGEKTLTSMSNALHVTPAVGTPPLSSVPQTYPDMPNLTFANPNSIPLPRKPSSNSVNGMQRAHSLALSEFSVGEPVPSDEEFVNPFADESELHEGLSFLPSPRSSRVLRNIIGDTNNQQGRDTNIPEGSRTTNGTNGRSSLGNMNSRSITELSDLEPDAFEYEHSYDVDFEEAMKSILDAVHPDLTSPEDSEREEKLPTLLMPWRGGALKRRNTSVTARVPRRTNSKIWENKQ